MPTIDRRTLLRGAGSAAFAAALPETIKRALAVQPASVTGTIMDVQHIVVLMQENRSFDHYYGTMRGVRGYSDPRAALITDTRINTGSVNTPSYYTIVPGNKVFNQPNKNGTGTTSTGSNPLQPFHPANASYFGYQFIGDLAHAWSDAHNAWNQGNNDNWVAAKGIETMVCYKRSDIPFHYALADAFTICDNYHCSIMSSTDPNRYYLWTGWVGQNGLTGGVQNDSLTNTTIGTTPGTFTLASGGNGAAPGGPVVNNSAENETINWITYPERLTAAGITWKFYQDMGGTNLANTSYGYTSNGYIGNYGDTSPLWFAQYAAANTAGHAGTATGAQLTMYNSACAGTNISASSNPGGAYQVANLFAQLQNDVMQGTLPQVSWVVAPYLFSEHPAATPNWGAWYVENVLAALVSNPAVWASTVFIINFDENDGFFDHIIAPTAPQTAAQGLSTVSTVNEIYPGVANSNSYAGPNPYGMGARVPCLVISPWSKGGYVCSQVFDHTSVLQFIAKRFGVAEPHITPWRAAVSGDLSSALNFAVRNTTAAHLPSTTNYLAGVSSGNLVSLLAQTTVVGGVTESWVQANKSFSSFSMSGQYPTTPNSLPAQESGLRLARPLPYLLQADAVAGAGSVAITFGNTGTAGAWFQVRTGVVVTATNTYGLATAATPVTATNSGGGAGPWGYTVDAVTQTLSDTFTPASTSYDLNVTSANGFYRRYAGTLGSSFTNLTVQCVYNQATGGISLIVTNAGSATVTVQGNEGYSGPSTQQSQSIAPGASATFSWPLVNSYSWYDIVLTTPASDTSFVLHYAGHVETGLDSTSDPYLGGVRPNFPANVVTILGTE